MIYLCTSLFSENEPSLAKRMNGKQYAGHMLAMCCWSLPYGTLTLRFLDYLLTQVINYIRLYANNLYIIMFCIYNNVPTNKKHFITRITYLPL